MSHHYSDFEALRELLGRQPGATGNYPNGKLSRHDEGEIQIAMTAWPSKGVVVIDFGKPVMSIGFTAAEAEGLIESLKLQLWKLRGIVGPEPTAPTVGRLDSDS